MSSRNEESRDAPKAATLLEMNPSGRTFWLDSNDVSEGVFNSVLGGSAFTGDVDEVMQNASPLISETWEFYSTAGLLSKDDP